MPVIYEDAVAVASQLPPLGGATVLVTDPTGVLGGYVVAILEATGARIVTVERRGSTLAMPSDRVDHIIHAGSPADLDTFRGDPVGALRACTATLVQLLDHARVHGAHVTFVSATEASRRGDLADTGSLYPAGNAAGEALCAAYREQYGVASSIIRLGYVYGPGFHADSTQVWAGFTRAAVAGETVVVRSTDDRRLPWTYAADAADAVLRTAITAAERDTTIAFEAVDERSRCDIRAFARAALHSAGRPPALAYQLSAPDRTQAAAAPTLRPAPWPPGWKPRTQLRDGVARTVSWYQDVLSATPIEAMVTGG